MTTSQIDSPVQLVAEDSPDQPTPTDELRELYRSFEKKLLVPLWTKIGDLMPAHPQSKASPYVWRWDAHTAFGWIAATSVSGGGPSSFRRARTQCSGSPKRASAALSSCIRTAAMPVTRK